METLVVVALHRNHYCGCRTKGSTLTQFGSSPTIRAINCRTFETSSGLLPVPFKDFGSPVLNQALSSPKPQKNPSASINGDVKKIVKSSPIPINLKDVGKKERQWRDNMSFSELWAGPAYSNSPPPSSLPIPKFSLKPKRTVSLELPVLESDFNLQPMAKSAPASPTGGIVSPLVEFLRNDDSATKTFRRILNLNIADDGGGGLRVG